MFEPIQNFFPGAIKTLGISKTFTAIHVCHAAQDAIQKIFTTEEARKNITTKSYSNKTLKLGVSSPLWAQEVLMKKEELARELNARFSEEVIKRIKTEINNN